LGSERFDKTLIRTEERQWTTGRAELKVTRIMGVKCPVWALKHENAEQGPGDVKTELNQTASKSFTAGYALIPGTCCLLLSSYLFPISTKLKNNIHRRFHTVSLIMY
jgi:hypothetical protein